MGKEGVPLQFDLFSGELVDNRSRGEKRRDKQRAEPQQLDMFPQNEIAQFGVSAHPQMPFDHKSPLELSIQDVRTPEEKEHDFRRASEALTYQLFEYDDAPQPSEDMSPIDDEADYDEATLTPPPVMPGADMYTLYIQLIAVAEEHAATLWIDPQYRGAFLALLGHSVVAAKQGGLTEDEITAALQIGEYRGKRSNQS